MIPQEQHIQALWEKYQLPNPKRVHVTLVAQVAVFLAEALKRRHSDYAVDVHLLRAAALLHDIDKAIPRLAGEHHPDTGVRVLKEEAMEEVAVVVATHPVHAILDERTAPKTLEEKLLFLADKMVKYDVIGVDKRFELWRNEHLGREVDAQLASCYPKVKALEQWVFEAAGLTLDKIIAGIRREMEK